MAEQVNAFKEEFPSIEQDNAMIDKAEKLIERNNPDRPEWLPEKFASAEELARSYQELERKVGQPQEQQAEAVKEVVDELEQQEDAVEEKAEEVKQVMSKLGLNFSEFEKEYNDSGELSDKAYQALEDKKAWLKGLTKRSLTRGEVIAEAPDFGTATLLIVRDSFKSVFKAVLYTIFVLAAVYHGFNGLWTFMVTWGVVLKMRSQSKAVNWCTGIMIAVGFLGLASIWGTYFINLRKNLR